MRGFNKVIIMGNLVRDPEVRYTQSNNAVASVSVAVNRVWFDQNKQKKEDTTYVPVVIWGKTAEMVQKYFSKGSGILVEGRLSTRSYDAKDGTKRYITEVVAEEIRFVGGGSDRSERPVSVANDTGYVEIPDTGDGIPMGKKTTHATAPAPVVPPAPQDQEDIPF